MLKAEKLNKLKRKREEGKPRERGIILWQLTSVERRKSAKKKLKESLSVKKERKLFVYAIILKVSKANVARKIIYGGNVRLTRTYPHVNEDDIKRHYRHTPTTTSLG
jgi:hypothetical protein